MSTIAVVDDAVAELDKYKHAPHLRVIVQAGTGHGAADTTVEYIAEVHARQEPDYGGWGAVVRGARKTDGGLHLFPDGLVFLEAHLRIVADEVRHQGLGGYAVAVQHTARKRFTTWRLFTPEAADRLADELDEAIPMPLIG